MTCGQKLLQAVERLHEWRAIRDELVDSLSSRADHKSLNEIELNVHHAFDSHYVVVKLFHQRKAGRQDSTRLATLQSVIKWFDNLISSNGESFKSAYEKTYGAPRLRHSSSTGHTPIVHDHRPHLALSGRSYASVFSDDEGGETTDEDDDDDENGGLTLTRTSSRRPSPPRSRSAQRRDDEDEGSDGDDESHDERGGRSPSRPSLRRSSNHRARSGSRRPGDDHLPARRPSLHRKDTTLERPPSRRGEEHAERSLGREGTYRMGRRYFARAY